MMEDIKLEKIISGDFTEEEKADVLEYVRGRNDALDDLPKKDNQSEAYEVGYSSGRNKVNLDTFRDWYTEYKKNK